MQLQPFSKEFTTSFNSANPFFSDEVPPRIWELGGPGSELFPMQQPLPSGGMGRAKTAVKVSTLIVTLFGLLFLGACNSGNQPTNQPSNQPSNQAANSTSSPAASTATTPSSAPTSNHGGQGGQVIESGAYHLELITVKEAAGTHIDFFLQKGDNHEPVANAKVIAQVQLPDGSQKSLDMKYDAPGQHYAAILPESTAGEYKVAILSDINGEKVNGRFSFKQ
jgi:hypothetical protein